MHRVGVGKASAGFLGVFTATLLGLAPPASAMLINYLAPTGQTATADFSFTDATHLEIILTETTPAGGSALTGAGAILTSLGFLLPDSAVIILPGTATIQPGSGSVGFDLGDLGAGTDVSHEWGATIGGEAPIDSVGSFDFVSTNVAQVTQFAGVNRDGPAVLDGPQAGLLDDSAARGGLGVIDNAVKILLTFDADPSMASSQGLTPSQQAAFLGSLPTTSIVEYGSNAAFGHPTDGGQVPAPATLLLLGAGVAVGGLARSRRSSA